MFGLGSFELILILVVVLVFFGAGKIPVLMQDMGRGLRNFKTALNSEVDGEYNNVTPDKEESPSKTI
jgi:sec-independent protein translocase protein TatA